MSRYQMVMGKGSNSKRNRKEEPDIMRWVLNLVVPLMTLFGILNLVVSGEAVEGLYKFFKSKGGEENNPYYAAADSYRNDEKRNTQVQQQPNFAVYQNYGVRQNYPVNKFQKQQVYMNPNIMASNQMQQAPMQQQQQQEQGVNLQDPADIPNLPNRNLIGQAPRPLSPVK